MKKTLLTLSAVFLSLCAMAQKSAREEIHDNILLTAANHKEYILPTEKLTPAPKGYQPFYICHYGRHGSRWLCGDGEYRQVLDPMRAAKAQSALTPKGLEVLEALERFYKCAINRAGELTERGERQHHGIGKRMTQNFPTVFSGKTAEVDARSTVVIRCILSMEAECEELTAFNPQLNIHNDVSESFQWYLNHNWDGKVSNSSRKRWPIVDRYKAKYTHPERLCRSLFRDEAYWNNDYFRPASFMRHLFLVVSNMQSHDNGEDLYPIFTEEEAYDMWRIINIDWYLGYGAAPQTDGNMPFSQRFLLRNMIETTDTVMASKSYTNGASLRFGHEVCVMPLACLMELGNSGAKVDDLDHLEDVWKCYDIYPMACNVQLVFYRSAKAKPGNLNVDDILVKGMLNEREVTLPIKTDTYPYYKWSDLRKYYIDKLNAFGE